MHERLTLVVDNSQQPGGGGRPATRPHHEHHHSAPEATLREWLQRYWRPASPVRAQRAQHPTAHRQVFASDRGAVTAEYAVVILAAVAFAGVLVAIMRSGEIREMLVSLVQNALGAAG